MKTVTFPEFKAACTKNCLDYYYHTSEAIKTLYPNDEYVKLVMTYSGITFIYKNGKCINAEEN